MKNAASTRMNQVEFPLFLQKNIALQLKKIQNKALKPACEMLKSSQNSHKTELPFALPNTRMQTNAYMAISMPITYAAISSVLNVVAKTNQTFNPLSMLDFGTGPGTAVWASKQQWPDIQHAHAVDLSVSMLETASLMSNINENLLNTFTTSRSLGVSTGIALKVNVNDTKSIGIRREEKKLMNEHDNVSVEYEMQQVDPDNNSQITIESTSVGISSKDESAEISHPLLSQALQEDKPDSFFDDIMNANDPQAVGAKYFDKKAEDDLQIRSFEDEMMDANDPKDLDSTFLPNESFALIKPTPRIPISQPDQYDLVISAFTLSELPTAQSREKTIQKLWSLTKDTLIIIDRGTPSGSAIVNSARSQILALKDGADIIAPCSHSLECPMIRAANNRKGKGKPKLNDLDSTTKIGDWCHFSQQLLQPPLTRLLNSSKFNSLDSKYSYIAFTRFPDATVRKYPRLILPPLKRDKHVVMDSCDPSGSLLRTVVSKKMPEPMYSHARKSYWGDLWVHPLAPGSKAVSRDKRDSDCEKLRAIQLKNLEK